MARERRVEPWPLALALALLCMIAASVAVYVIAVRNPDPVVSHESRPGLER